MHDWAIRCALIVAVVAAVVLVGWATDVAWLRSFVPGAAETKINTAIALSTAAAALLLTARQRAQRARLILALATTAIAVVTLAEYLTGAHFGIDAVFSSDHGAVWTEYPGRMAPATAIGLALCGVALTSWHRSTVRALMAGWMALASSTIGSVALIGYAAGVPTYLSLDGVTRMSLPGAISLVILGVGIALVGEDRGPLSVLVRQTPGGWIARRLVPLVVLFPPILGVLRWQGQAAGWYGTNIGIVLLVSSFIACGLAAIAIVVRGLDRLDASRRSFETALRLQSEITAEMAEGVAVVRWSDSQIVYANPRLERMLGLTQGSLTGRGSDAITFVTDDRPAFEVARRDTLRTSGRWSEELAYVRADGSRFWGRVTVSSFDHPEHGDVSVAVIADVTERHMAAAQLGHQAGLFDSVLRAAANHSIVGTDLDGLITIFNAGAERMLGYAASDMVGRRTPEILHLEEEIVTRADELGIDPGFEVFVADARRGRADTRDWTYVRSDGSRLLVSLTVTAITDADGQLLGFIGIATDVTDERNARAAQSAAELQFRRSFDEALVGMQIFDLEGRYLAVNDAFCAIVGYSRDRLLGMGREQITHPDDHLVDAESLQSLLRGETRSYTRDKRYIHAAGHPVWASISVTLIDDAAGRPHHFIAQAQDITERRRYEDQLKHMADHDPLTGLLNRRSFQRELQNHVARVKRFGLSGAVLMVDLDNFKYYNDTQGHNAGDELIVRIAHGLRDRLRETDVIARLGGDEFAVLLPQEDQESAAFVAKALLDHVREQAPPSPMGPGKSVTASIGIACFDPTAGLTPDEMMINADLAMYDAKEHGRDRVAHYRTDEHERPRIESQMKWATEITDALANDRFQLMAQPITQLSGVGATQYELLLRMRTRDGDLIPPGTFLYIAERLGLIGDIDRWVTDQAITMLAASPELRLEVNLSGHTIGDPALLEMIETRLETSGVEPDRLIFEITETAAVANIARAASFAQRLSELGCKFALDDFGAGFGSFYYLKHLPFDYLKIDGEFVRHCAANETDRTLISGVVQIARGMGKLTVAEFVEDQETVEVLRRLGVDYGQGYHLGRPARLDEYLRQPSRADRIDDRLRSGNES